MGFKKEKKEVLKRLLSGNYLHEARSNISEKNLLQTGKVSAETAAKIISKARGEIIQQAPIILLMILKCTFCKRLYVRTSPGISSGTILSQIWFLSVCMIEE